ncbi:MAG: sodium:solute symporter [Bacteroidales bacterium]|jgi:Na+/proline symporter|nr:sodium:solute symporter [Bacteroidales bacterium]
MLLWVTGIYFCVIWMLSAVINRRAASNDAFFMGTRRSPWYAVAIGALGDSISGVTFVSAPGMVGSQDMTYMQMVLGFVPGYALVAFLLLPLYYRINMASIYAWLGVRFGGCAYRTGSLFFLLSRMVGTASKLYLIILVFQTLAFDGMGIPFWLTTAVLIGAIWLYTRRGGMRTIVWTDVLQTACLIAALLLIIRQTAVLLDLSPCEAVCAVIHDRHARIFEFADWRTPQNFFKQFFSGMFIVVVMTGLDQNMMQKNLTCRSLREAQRNMLAYGAGFVPLNLLFLSLGVLLLQFAGRYGVQLPPESDRWLPLLASRHLGMAAFACFTVGIVASSFTNADSALTAMTTSACVDLLHTDAMPERKAVRVRQGLHLLMSLLLLLSVLLFRHLGSGNILTAVYTAASYTYGPLLGMYAFGLLTRRRINDRYAPCVCIAAPLLCLLCDRLLLQIANYHAGYEILLLNGLLTMLGLWGISRKNDKPVP